MQDYGPLIALIFFILGTAFFSYLANEDFKVLFPDEQNEETHLAYKVTELKNQEDQILSDMALVREEIRDTRNKIVTANVNYNFHDWFFNQYYIHLKSRQKQVKQAESFGEAAGVLAGEVEAEKDKTSQKIRTRESEVMDEKEKVLIDTQKRRDEAASLRAKIEQIHEIDKTKYRKQKNLEESELAESKAQLEDLAKAVVKRVTLSLDADGKVIKADTLRNSIVINLGTANGVKNGFRFECYRLKPGNRKHHKAYIEVRKAEKNVSECFVVQKVIEMPTDPLSGYIAKEPEEIYSPRVGKGSAQILSGAPKIIKKGMSPTNPILTGDLVLNPFYNQNQTYTWYIAGNKELKHGLQKSAIHYTWRHIADVIKKYGGRVVEKVDSDVDFILAQKNALPTDASPQGQADYDPEAVHGVALGVPVLYEWEFFRFLDDR